VKKPIAFGVRGLLVVVFSLVLVGCGSNTETLVLTQDSAQPPVLTPLDLNPAGSNGDTTVFEVPVQIDGEPAGSVVGSMMKVSGLGEGARMDREERMYSAVFVLPNGQISVLGVSYYTESATLLPVGEPVTRAIVGGTGDYFGIKGEVATVHNSDDTYTHTMSFIR